jgi:diketogulonate reductase-like aldo/keto reductase
MIEITLNNNSQIPALGFGTWNLAKNTAAEAVTTAIKAGYRHIDCAMVYENEKQVGAGITQAIGENLVSRKELFVTSKLWNTDHDPGDVETAFRKTIQDLGVEYLDLYLVHWGVSFEHGDELEPLDDDGLAKLTYVPLQETWHAMESLVEKGLVKSIGVANYSSTMLIDLLGYAKIKPVMNQIELHPYHSQEALVKFCKSQNIAVTAYSPLSSNGTVVLKDEVIKNLAKKYSKTESQIVLRWAMQRETVAIPKASHAERIAENFAIFDFEINDEDMKLINDLDKRLITCNPLGWWGFPYFS